MNKKLLLLKKKNFKNVLFIMTLFFSITISSQTLPSDFWQCFEKITTISGLEEYYPDTNGETSTFNLMNHGIQIPSLENHSFQSNIAVNLLDKNSILNQNISEFFIIHEAKYLNNQAYFEVVFYYNFSGNYLHYKSVKINLTKSNGNWSIIDSTIE